MGGNRSDLRAVQERLQELLDTAPAAQADVLEAIVRRTPQEVVDASPDRLGGGDDRAIIVVGGRGRGRSFVFDLSDVLDDLNPQPLPPEPDIDLHR